MQTNPENNKEEVPSTPDEPRQDIPNYKSKPPHKKLWWLVLALIVVLLSFLLYFNYSSYISDKEKLGIILSMDDMSLDDLLEDAFPDEPTPGEAPIDCLLELASSDKPINELDVTEKGEFLTKNPNKAKFLKLDCQGVQITCGINDFSKPSKERVSFNIGGCDKRQARGDLND